MVKLGLKLVALIPRLGGVDDWDAHYYQMGTVLKSFPSRKLVDIYGLAVGDYEEGTRQYPKPVKTCSA